VGELVKVHLAYVEYRARSAREAGHDLASEAALVRPAFEHARTHLATHSTTPDPYAQLERYQIRLEVRRGSTVCAR
jgi:hypothetical protein